MSLVMKVLIIGGGGREHVLAETYSRSKSVTKVFVAPGNDFMSFTNKKITTVPDIDVLDFEKIVQFAKSKRIDLVDVAQDNPLAAGFIDKLETAGILAFGPTQKASQIEWSKEWARNFMLKYKLPIPKFKTFTSKKKAIDYVTSMPSQVLYVKASGLALGKGSIRVENRKEAKDAIAAMRKFGKSGETFLIEEGLVGEEFSLFAICDGNNYVPAKSSQDHKTVYDGDKGPNTGGIGCVAPTSAITQKILKDIEIKIIKPTIAGMKKEGRPYSGILYLGGMITKNGIRIIEFNSRWGDPEAQVILPSIKTDYTNIVEAVHKRELNKLSIRFDKRVRISVAGCARGYPNDYSEVKGKEVFGLLDAMKVKGVTIYGAGIKRKGRQFFVHGGRVFHLVAQGDDIMQARKRAYEAMAMISIEGNNLHYRTDIGWRDVARINACCR